MDLDMLGLSQRQYPSGGDSSKAEMGRQKITHGASQDLPGGGSRSFGMFEFPEE